MTSGDIANAPGPEAGVISDGTYAWVGDGDLEAAIPGLNAGDTNNASIIEFDFVPVTDHMSFDFIFAAEEYGTFQCTFTDAFAFLLTDTAGVTTNLGYCSLEQLILFLSFLLEMVSGIPVVLQ